MSLSLSNRFVILGLNITLLYIVFIIANGTYKISGGLESVWFMAAIAMWLATLISSYFFTPPRDALANAVGAVLSLVTLDLTASMMDPIYNGLDWVRWLAVAYCLIVIVSSLSSLFIYEKDKQSSWGDGLYRISSTLGQGELLFTPLAIISMLTAYRDNPITAVWLIFTWVFFTICKPFEKILWIKRNWSRVRNSKNNSPVVGIVERIDDPNILRIQLNKLSSWKKGQLHIAVFPNDEQHYVLALSKQIRGTEVVGTGICLGLSTEDVSVKARDVVVAPDNGVLSNLLQGLSGSPNVDIVGFVVENSVIGTIRFEVATDKDLSEGDMIFSRINNVNVFYQILDAETSEESFENNPRGIQIVKAAQVGMYDSTKGFVKYPWLPKMNSPLFSADALTFPQPVSTSREFVIGKLPAANLEVLANIDDLVEYHTAILGVTGTGKTELSLSLIREAISKGAKVFCVDFTGEYKSRLSDLNPVFPTPDRTQLAELDTKLFAVETGTYGAGAEKAALNAYLKTLKTQAATQINNFLISDTDKLAIFELSEMSNTKATLRITELYLSLIMAWARKYRRARQVMLALEEAHTIIPEPYGSGLDGDTKWVVERIGQIALQGRKYGVGLLVISQRTALVSKTILSQCNTFLTHSLIDGTSLGFLESVYSSQHVKLIPNLQFGEFLAFGKALKAERPVLLKREFDPALKAASDALRAALPALPSEAVQEPTNSTASSEQHG